MSEKIIEGLKPNETIMSHFYMEAPPPNMPYDVAARISNEDLHLRPAKPNHAMILKELEKIGDDWHKRDEHTNPLRKDKTRELLEGPHTSAWHYMKGQETIGFCVAVQQGFNGEMPRIAERFNLAVEDGVEIYKVGLKPEWTDKGYGNAYLPLTLIALINGQSETIDENGHKVEAIEPSSYVYLNTRPLSNTVDSRAFYSRLGFSDGGTDTWPIPKHEFNELGRRHHANSNSKGRVFVPRSPALKVASASRKMSPSQ